MIKYGSSDEYRPHCDGDCTGVEFKPGGRVATMVSEACWSTGDALEVKKKILGVVAIAR